MKEICKSCNMALCQGRVPIFKGLTDEELMYMSEIIEHKSYEKNEYVFSEGEIADKLIIVHSGEIKLFKTTLDGKEQILDILVPGDFTGELDLFDKSEYNYNCMALKKSMICSINQTDISDLILKNPKIGIKIISSMNKKVIRLQNLAQNLATNDSQVRLINLILDLYDKNGFNPRIQLNLTREELANYLGLTRETVSRKLMNLKNDGYIEIVGTKELIIKDLDGLKNYIP